MSRPSGTYFPIGFVYFSVVSTNPGTLLGYGTWIAFGAGKVPVGLDSGDTDFDTAEETGGAKTHTLTSAEMPSHSHTQNSHNHTQDAHTHNLVPTTATTGSATATQAVFATDTSATVGSPVASGNISSATATNQSATATNQNTGGGGAHNNLQPYIVVYMFKRTA